LIIRLCAQVGNISISTLEQDRDQVRAKRRGVNCTNEGDENELGAIHLSRCAQVSTFSYTPVYQPVLLYLDGLHLLGTKCALASLYE
jgi:hypothetical protein